MSFIGSTGSALDFRQYRYHTLSATTCYRQTSIEGNKYRSPTREEQQLNRYNLSKNVNPVQPQQQQRTSAVRPQGKFLLMKSIPQCKFMSGVPRFTRSFKLHCGKAIDTLYCHFLHRMISALNGLGLLITLWEFGDANFVNCFLSKLIQFAFFWDAK